LVKLRHVDTCSCIMEICIGCFVCRNQLWGINNVFGATDIAPSSVVGLLGEFWGREALGGRAPTSTSIRQVNYSGYRQKTFMFRQTDSKELLFGGLFLMNACV